MMTPTPALLTLRAALVAALCLACLAASAVSPGPAAQPPAPPTTGAPTAAQNAAPATPDSAKATAPALDARQQKISEAARADVTILAADDMEGRGIGTKGIARAAGWIEKQLRSEGLRPVFGKSYRQSFRVKTGVALAAGNTVAGLADSEWVPLGFSSSGKIEGELAFLGYGIESPSVGYDEFAGVDLKGKVALMLRYEPQEKDENSPFDGKKPSRWSALRYKTMKAREKGAVAVIFVTGPVQDEGKNKLPALANDGPESPAGIPVIQVRTSTAERWLAPLGTSLLEFQRTVDRDLTPRSRGATGIRVAGNVALDATYADTENLAGMLPGRGPLAKEYVVVGAHYDHLGYGGRGSMRPNERAIHNGADDNASGTASVLLAAREAKRALEKQKSHRTVVFALFSAEEVGLAGSSWFVQHPPFPIASTAAMVNLDMVGRLRDNHLVILGAESATQWKDEIGRANSATGLDISSRGDGYGPSDQTAFYGAGIPVLHLFTGAHDIYHTPDDDAVTLNYDGMARVVDFTATLAANVARGDTRPMYARATTAPLMEGDSRGYGAYLGTVPDYTAMEATEGGVLLADVRAGGPAERAGIRGKDRIVEMAGTKIENLYDMTYALQDNRPGQTVDVVVIRDNQRKTLHATLGDRATMGSPGAAAAHAAPAAPAGSPPPHAADSTRGAPPAAPGAAPAMPPPGMGGGTAAPAESARAALPIPGMPPGPDFTPAVGKPFEPRFEGEWHLKDIRQLTFGGENAEPYWSPDGKKLMFQATVPGAKCDQQYVYDLVTGDVKLVSSGKGRTTCGYFDYPEGDAIIYASTEAGSDACPPSPDMSKGYVWALYNTFDLYIANLDGSNARRVTNTPGYDAEATWSHRGGRIIFTSMRDGDLDLYSMDEAGGDIRRLTNTPGYDGGAFFSPDGSEIVWRAGRPEGEALKEYRDLLSQNLIRPRNVEVFVAKADGSSVKQLTNNGKANFCPTFLPDGKRILWASNVGSTGGQEFDLWLMNKDGSAPERVTTAPGFDGFPHFSPDGRWVVWASNRANPKGHDTNLFLARWVDSLEGR
jgi:Tol biopolymer transport system component